MLLRAIKERKMPNPQSYFEIRVTDYERSYEFYTKVFEWEIKKSWGEMPYGIIKPGDGQEGGLGENPADKPPRVIIYFRSEDIDATLKAIEEAGGKIVTPKTLITEEYGYFAHFSDPDGNVIGLSGEK